MTLRSTCGIAVLLALVSASPALSEPTTAAPLDRAALPPAPLLKRWSETVKTMPPLPKPAATFRIDGSSRHVRPYWYAPAAALLLTREYVGNGENVSLQHYDLSTGQSDPGNTCDWLKGKAWESFNAPVLQALGNGRLRFVATLPDGKRSACDLPGLKAIASSLVPPLEVHFWMLKHLNAPCFCDTPFRWIDTDGKEIATGQFSGAMGPVHRSPLGFLRTKTGGLWAFLTAVECRGDCSEVLTDGTITVVRTTEGTPELLATIPADGNAPLPLTAAPEWQTHAELDAPAWLLRLPIALAYRRTWTIETPIGPDRIPECLEGSEIWVRPLDGAPVLLDRVVYYTGNGLDLVWVADSDGVLRERHTDQTDVVTDGNMLPIPALFGQGLIYVRGREVVAVKWPL